MLYAFHYILISVSCCVIAECVVPFAMCAMLQVIKVCERVSKQPNDEYKHVQIKYQRTEMLKRLYISIATVRE